eukprot:s1331_g20.t1
MWLHSLAQPTGMAKPSAVTARARHAAAEAALCVARTRIRPHTRQALRLTAFLAHPAIRHAVQRKQPAEEMALPDHFRLPTPESYRFTRQELVKTQRDLQDRISVLSKCGSVLKKIEKELKEERERSAKLEKALEMLDNQWGGSAE